MANYFKEKDAYEEAFYNFDPEKVAQMTSKDIDRLMEFPNIVHNRKKLEAIVSQAQGYLKSNKIIIVLVISCGHM